jgi:hypothetical protein
MIRCPSADRICILLPMDEFEHLHTHRTRTRLKRSINTFFSQHNVLSDFRAEKLIRPIVNNLQIHDRSP